MAANHLDNISITITLAPAPLQIAGFGIPLIIADHTTSTLDGDRVRTYTSTTAAAADVTAGFLSAAMLAAVTAAFSQRSPPAAVKVGRTDAGDADMAATYAALVVADPDFYGVATETRTPATQVNLAAAVEATNRIYVLQSSDADWMTAGIPAAYATIDGNERTAVVYHDTATVWADFAWLANRLVFDPDSRSAPWDCAVQGVAAYAAAPSDTQKGHLDDNYANNGLPYGSETFFLDPGVNLAGRPLHEIVTADWFRARLQEAIVGVKTAASARGDKIVVGPSGQALILAEIAALFQRGVNAKHFVAGQTEQTAVTITSTDLDLGRLRFTGRAQLASSARIFTFTFDFSRTALYDEIA